jgi:hypothetical protein
MIREAAQQRRSCRPQGVLPSEGTGVDVQTGLVQDPDLFTTPCVAGQVVPPGSKDGKGGEQAIAGRSRPKEAAPDREGHRASDDQDGHQHDGQLQAAAGDLQPVVAMPLVAASVFLVVGAPGQLLIPSWPGSDRIRSASARASAIRLLTAGPARLARIQHPESQQEPHVKRGHKEPSGQKTAVIGGSSPGPITSQDARGCFRHLGYRAAGPEQKPF